MHPVQVVGLEQTLQYGIEVEHSTHEPLDRYWVAVQAQLVGEWRVKVGWQSVQEVELVQDWQLEIAEEQLAQAPKASKY